MAGYDGIKPQSRHNSGSNPPPGHPLGSERSHPSRPYPPLGDAPEEPVRQDRRRDDSIIGRAAPSPTGHTSIRPAR
jgi:hypothetical protein